MIQDKVGVGLGGEQRQKTFQRSHGREMGTRGERAKRGMQMYSTGLIGVERKWEDPGAGSSVSCWGKCVVFCFQIRMG